jgi:hypothetical protein
MKSIAALTLAVALTACVSKSELDTAQQQNTQLQAQVAELQKRVAELEAQLARKPALPVKVSFRKAMIGNGLVAVFETTTKESFPILVSVNNKAIGAVQHFRLDLRSQYPSELGHMEGASIAPGDEISVENKSYSPMKLVVPQ